MLCERNFFAATTLTWVREGFDLIYPAESCMNFRLKYFVVSCAMMISLSGALEHRAYAYVDPGSGLLLFQSLSAVLTGGLFFFRKRLKSLMSRSKIEKAASEQSPK